MTLESKMNEECKEVTNLIAQGLKRGGLQEDNDKVLQDHSSDPQLTWPAKACSSSPEPIANSRLVLQLSPLPSSHRGFAGMTEL